jgi:hypothetical protein
VAGDDIRALQAELANLTRRVNGLTVGRTGLLLDHDHSGDGGDGGVLGLFWEPAVNETPEVLYFADDIVMLRVTPPPVAINYHLAGGWHVSGDRWWWRW